MVPQELSNFCGLIDFTQFELVSSFFLVFFFIEYSWSYYASIQLTKCNLITTKKDIRVFVAFIRILVQERLQWKRLFAKLQKNATVGQLTSSQINCGSVDRFWFRSRHFGTWKLLAKASEKKLCCFEISDAVSGRSCCKLRCQQDDRQ